MGFKIFVGNLSYEATEDELRELFTAYGAVDSVRIIKDRETGKPRGFAFVEMSREADCQNAVKAMDGYRHQNRNLRVSVAEPQQPGGGPRGPGGPPRGPGGFGGPRPAHAGQPPGEGGGGGGGGGDANRFGPDKEKRKWTVRKDKNAVKPKVEDDEDGGGNTRRWDRFIDDE